MSAGFRRLLPAPASPDGAPVGPGAVLDGPDLRAAAPAGRPYVIANFAVTADGRTTLADGRSGGIGDEGDRAVFHALRGAVDAVMAGTQTIAKEGYGRLVRDAGRRGERERAGLAADPVAVVVSRSGRLPLAAPIFAAPGQPIAVFAPHGTSPPQVPARVDLVTSPEPSLPGALADLRARLGVRLLLCEGGATVFGALVAAGLLDELFLTVAPALAGGEGPSLAGPTALPRLARLDLIGALERSGSLYLRYRLRPA